ncbi:lectin like domain-containing protein [Methanoplanus endosymbiosus]|uniref:Lectin like domain-containing protein n=1 Tax=Methanoplanus endosymbiosus TaxID=33865 RepID=A0A9E7PPM9_9EURY|nr:lectin like domain-containing protein [Methanoplanus endosymbiosus]UUX92556.1 lectin like domain-containing protein [Methanoplanus endosymbiosus]
MKDILKLVAISIIFVLCLIAPALAVDNVSDLISNQSEVLQPEETMEIFENSTLISHEKNQEFDVNQNSTYPQSEEEVPSVVQVPEIPDEYIMPSGFAPINPEFIEWQMQHKDDNYLFGECNGGSCNPTFADDVFGEVYYTGEIPSPAVISSKKPDLTMISGDDMTIPDDGALPSSYDLRDYGRVTSVKNQGGCGSCWTFATYGSLESYFLVSESETYDFSENNMKNKNGFAALCCAGGNAYKSTAYLTRWDVPDCVSWYTGPVSESDDPYDDSSCLSPSSPEVQKHVQDVFYLYDQPASDNSLAKTMIKNYGALHGHVYWNYTTAINYATSAPSYYFDSSKGMVSNGGHAITLVGWDDLYSKTNFNVQPPGDGAFIAKNSWGTGWGNDGGYFMISYYDQRIKNGMVLFTAEGTENYEKLYDHSPFGYIGSYGAGSTTFKFSNVYTAGGDEKIQAIGFFTNEAGAEYTINVYKNPESGPVNTTAGSLSIKTGTAALAGYHTVKLTTPVDIQTGDKFSVVIEITNPEYNYPACIEYNVANYLTQATSAKGQSYYYNGVSWLDLYDWNPSVSPDFCIKVYTDDYSSESAPVADFSALPVLGTAPLKVAFNDTSTGNPTSWSWNFGDGDTSTLQNPEHTYTESRNYSISLEVSNSAGSDSITKTDYIIVTESTPEPGKISWQKCFGGSDYDYSRSIIQTSDDGYIATGSTESTNGDVFGDHGSTDVWVVKLNSEGVFSWQKCLGGSSADSGNSIAQTTDGGYIVAGTTESYNGDVSGKHSYQDVWVVKLNSAGSMTWQKCLGGTSYDYGKCILQTSDGGYIVAGYTGSLNGDVSGNHGYSDGWVVKLNSTGSLTWQKCLGGSDYDYFKNIVQTSDGGYILVGYTKSTNGDVSGNHGNYDIWVVKLNADGNLLWQRCLGGSNTDEGNIIIQSSDGGYVITGETYSHDGTSNKEDIIVAKLDADGNTLWQKFLGGSLSDIGNSIVQTSDGGYILTGETYSLNGDVSGNHGSSDVWVVKLDSSGNFIWQKCLGGDESDSGESIVQTSDGGYIVAGYTKSTNGDVSGNHGSSDVWVVKLEGNGMPQSEFTASPIAGTKPLEVQFTDESTGNPTSWLWDFGDGDTSTLQNPEHTYTESGNYSVSLEVSNSAGSNSITKTDYISVSGLTPSDGEWTIPLFYEFSSLSGRHTDFRELAFGTKTGATDSYDEGIDTRAAPADPDGYTQYFKLTGSAIKLYKDFRPIIDEGNNENSWTLKLICGDAEEDITREVTLSWDTSELNENVSSLTLNVAGETIDMTTQSSYTFETCDLLNLVEIKAGSTSSIDIPLKNGWNFISIPLSNAIITPGDGVDSTVYLYNSSIQNYNIINVDDMEQLGAGYWVYANKNTSISIVGIPLLEYSSDLKTGWNTIGSLSKETTTAELITDPDNSLGIEFYFYDAEVQNYRTALNIDSGMGIWTWANNDCNLYCS